MTGLVVLSAVLGLAVGSFLNVVIYRVPRHQSIVSPASRCPCCDAPIRLRHNVPVFGWLLLRGRCADCHEPISPRYPAVEALTAALFVALTLHFGAAPELPAFLYLAAAGVSLAMIDWDDHRIPNAIVLPSYVAAVLLLMPAGAVDADWWHAVRALLAMGLLWLLYLALASVYPAATGRGYVKLAGLLGLYLGWLSWAVLLIGTIGGLVIGIACGAALLASAARHGGVARPRRRVPSGTLRRLPLGTLWRTPATTLRRLPLGTSMLVGAALAVLLVGPVGAAYRALLPS